LILLFPGIVCYLDGSVTIYPQFACFDAMGDGTCKLTCFSSWQVSERDSGESRVVGMPFLKDIHGERSRETDFECRMKGALPDSARAKVAEAIGEFDDVFLVAEMSPTDWKATVAAVDPLIVGHVEGAFWLVGWFDLTDAEDYVLGTCVR